MNIFEEIAKTEGKISEKKQLTQQSQTNENKLVLIKTGYGYKNAEPMIYPISEEDRQKYAKVAQPNTDNNDLFAPNIFKKIAGEIRARKIAKYIKNAKKYSPEKREEIREKAIKLLSKPLYCDCSGRIVKMVAAEEFEDRLQIYPYIHNADADDWLFTRAKRETKRALSVEKYENILKYISNADLVFSGMGPNEFFYKLNTEQMAKLYEARRDDCLSQMISYSDMFKMPKEHLELGLKMGIICVRADDIESFSKTLYYKQSEYIREFCAEILKIENQKNQEKNNKPQSYKIIEPPRKTKEEVEQIIDNIFAEAQDNIEKEI